MTELAVISAVDISADKISLTLADGRIITVPMSWAPKLMAASQEDVASYVIDQTGVHWAGLDEHLLLIDVLKGAPEKPILEKIEAELSSAAEKFEAEFSSAAEKFEAHMKSAFDSAKSFIHDITAP
jgi:hypothetical protein